MEINLSMGLGSFFADVGDFEKLTGSYTKASPADFFLKKREILLADTSAADIENLSAEIEKKEALLKAMMGSPDQYIGAKVSALNAQITRLSEQHDFIYASTQKVSWRDIFSPALLRAKLFGITNADKQASLRMLSNEIAGFENDIKNLRSFSAQKAEITSLGDDLAHDQNLNNILKKIQQHCQLQSRDASYWSAPEQRQNLDKTNNEIAEFNTLFNEYVEAKFRMDNRELKHSLSSEVFLTLLGVTLAEQKKTDECIPIYAAELGSIKNQLTQKVKLLSEEQLSLPNIGILSQAYNEIRKSIQQTQAKMLTEANNPVEVKKLQVVQGSNFSRQLMLLAEMQSDPQYVLLENEISKGKSALSVLGKAELLLKDLQKTTALPQAKIAVASEKELATIIGLEHSTFGPRQKLLTLQVLTKSLQDTLMSMPANTIATPANTHEPLQSKLRSNSVSTVSVVHAPTHLPPLVKLSGKNEIYSTDAYVGPKNSSDRKQPLPVSANAPTVSNEMKKNLFSAEIKTPEAATEAPSLTRRRTM
jgi:hypothetical protein